MNVTTKGYLVDDEVCGQVAHCYNIRYSGDKVQFVDEKTGRITDEYPGDDAVKFLDRDLYTRRDGCIYSSWFLYKYD